MNSLINILQNWAATEPIASLWLGISSVLLFGVTFRSLTNQAGLSWGRGFFAASTKTFGVVSLVGACYFLLNSSFKTFSELYGSFTTRGSISNRAWQEWRNLYGGS